MLDCGSIMRPMKQSLHQDEPTQTAIQFMLKNHMGLVPVVDAEERFVGLMSGDRLMHFLLPKQLTMVRGLDRMSFLRESKEELNERLGEIAILQIREVMDTRAQVVHPDTPLIEAQKILAGTQFVVPVVERESGKLLGAISFFTVISMLQGVESWSEHIATISDSVRNLESE